VELLVVITIIGILIGMLLPAVNSARESGRNLQCKNNLKQLGLAVLAHEREQGFFPTGGWGWYWVGDPDRGYSEQQPGGWIYNTLPNTEMSAIHDQEFTVNGQKLSGRTPPGQSPSNAAKAKGMLQMVQTPLPFTNCPTRRRPALYAFSQPVLAYNVGGVNPPAGIQVSRTDYAINCGSVQGLDQYGTGPAKGADAMQVNGSLSATAAAAQYAYFVNDPNRHLASNSIAATEAANFQKYTGISFELSTLRKDDVTDGVSCTLMLGEKYLGSDSYGTGKVGADNENQFAGFDNDIGRTTYRAPMQDRWGLDDTDAFGSAHPNAANFVLCDGAAISINYSVDPNTFKLLGSRNDGAALDMSKVQ